MNSLINSQTLKEDTLKYTNIETVVINDKDYEKIEYFYGLKQEINSRFISLANSEMGLKFKNNFNQKGRITEVVLFLHKTDSDTNLTELEINFYKIDSLTKMPSEKINHERIVYKPLNKKRGKIKIDVKKYNLAFPKDGVFVAVKWLPNRYNDRNVGPSLRQTNYKEQITYSRFREGKWFMHGSHSKEKGLYTNAMIGLEVYVKKKKKY